MNEALFVLTAAGLATWVLRVGLINLVPARTLPPRIQRALQVTGPAAMSALIVTDVSHYAARGPTSLIAAVAGTFVAAIIVWRWGNLIAVAGAGMATYWLVLTIS